MTRPIVVRLALAAAFAIVVVTATVALSAPRRPYWVGGKPVVPSPASPPSAAPARFEGWSDPANVGKPYGDKVAGLLTFRGNPTRTFYGTGPMPTTAPARRWQFPQSGGLCSLSTDRGVTKEWCGSGW